MPNSFTAKSAKRVDRKPGKNGMIKVTTVLNFSEDVYAFIMERAESEKRSISAMASILFEEDKQKRERLGL